MGHASKFRKNFRLGPDYESALDQLVHVGYIAIQVIKEHTGIYTIFPVKLPVFPVKLPVFPVLFRFFP